MVSIQQDMDFQINCTQDGTKQYPLHKHNQYEIIIYLSGEGFLKTLNEKYAFSPGTIIIVPPGLEHRSLSENGFKNISVSGNFGQYLFFKKPVISRDNEYHEGRSLAEIIYNNRFINNDFLSALCLSFVYFVLGKLKIDDNINIEINKLIKEISRNFHDCTINLSELLKESGYAEDYIRSRFKEITGKTPKKFLKNVRIKHACYLIEIYANKMSLAQVCEYCGYSDYILFSKNFREIMGISPREYKNKASGMLSPNHTEIPRLII